MDAIPLQQLLDEERAHRLALEERLAAQEKQLQALHKSLQQAQNNPDRKTWAQEVNVGRYRQGNGGDMPEAVIEEQVKKSEERYREIFDYSQAWICIHDLEGHLISINPYACHTLGYRYEEIVGTNIRELMPAKYRNSFQVDYLQYIVEHRSSEGVMCVQSKSGDQKFLLYQNYLAGEGEDAYIIGFAQDITARLNAEEALKHSEEKFRNIIENMNLGMVEMDNEQCIKYANHSFSEISGYQPEELIGKKADFFLRGEGVSTFNENMLLRKGGLSNAYELEVRNKRGQAKWWLISGAPLYDKNGAFVGSTDMYLDITTQKELEADLRTAKQDADNASRAKEVFIANISHEIRTPMNAIKGMTQLLQRTSLNSQQEYYLNAIATASENLLVIINDVLDLSKVQEGKIEFEEIGFTARVLMEHAVNLLQYKAEEKGLQLGFEVDKAVAPVLIGDPYRINQVLMNLMSNAIKFTESGSVSIGCKLVSQDKSKQKLCFTVTDTGIGIEEEFIKRIFEKFSQEDSSVTRKYGGTGLGMSISKQLVELMGGNMEISSRKNEGTVISFTISLEIGTRQDLPAKKIVVFDKDILAGKKILLVEDNDLNRLIAATILRNYKAEISSAVNGSIAVDMLRRQLYDVVLMDMQMPVMDGIEATQLIRKEISADIPIIALTANALKGEAEHCLSAGMNDYLAKPFDEAKLMQVVTKWVNVGKQNVEEDTKDNVAPLYNLSSLNGISRGNSDFVLKMLQLFVTEVPNSIRRMNEAFANNDIETVRTLAHRIKPSLQNMGIDSLREGIIYIETAVVDEIDPDVMAAYLKKLTNTVSEVATQLTSRYDITM
ncbi:MAG: PAS domain S-box protein [Taibaiella sp.]|nr:PAS domain S-box protein [Taibaiella sp.]